MKRARSCLAFVIFVSLFLSAWAQEPWPLFGAEERDPLDRALSVMNMTEDDLRFARDHGEPDFVLTKVKDLLVNPLGLPLLAEEAYSRLVSPPSSETWTWMAGLLECPPPGRAAESVLDRWQTPAELERRLAAAVEEFVAAACVSADLAGQGFARVDEENRAYALASLMAGIRDLESHDSVVSALLDGGISGRTIDRIKQEADELDPEPAARRWLEIAEQVDLAALLSAASVLRQAAARLAADAKTCAEWPAAVTRIETPLGTVLIGTRGDDVLTGTALLVLDPGGDDDYRDTGFANGLQRLPVAALVDLDGDDSYRSTRLLGTGAAAWGVCAVIDAGGHDVYAAQFLGQGCGLFGCGLQEDLSGDDLYQGLGFAQGAGVVGLGWLRDEAGCDRYRAGLAGQAYAGVRGLGALIDVAGSDLYEAGGREPDHERNDDRFLSLAQGFAIGLRPYAGGGYAFLVDDSGSDTYLADVFGQGVSYWYSVAMLLDRSGHDRYSVFQYGQGTGIHLSLGLLADGGGNDRYDGDILTQGSAHDYAVGMLLDQNGHDTYAADHHSQGRAMNNALALLLDKAGDDAYFGRDPDQCQGVGNDGGNREYGSLALLLDLDGKDTYSCGAANDQSTERPDFGVIYDHHP